jgi:2-dehydropantoate 2-reductase
VKFAILGPGGVGGFLGALLARDGSEIVLIGRSAGDRVRLESARFGTFEVAVRSAQRLDEAVEAVLVTVKGTQLDEALERVPRDALGDALVVPFLNGLDHVEMLRRAYPPSSVVAATIRIETAKVGPGVIRHTSPFAAIELAPSPENRDRVERLAARLAATGLDVKLREDEHQMLWDKFAVLEPMALLTTHARTPIGPARTDRRADLLALVSEVVAAGTADGVDLDEATIVRFIDSVPDAMESSMQRDQAAGRPLELDALGGALLRRAARYGIDAPATRRIVDELAAREKN